MKGKSFRGEAGQTMVEIAFVMALFLLFVLAIIEIGRLWAAKHSVTLAAREGARVLILPSGAGLTYGSDSDVQAAAVETTRNYLNNTGVPVAATTQIIPIRVTMGPDNLFGTGDDVIEKNYSEGRRGERVGIHIKHDFDTPLAAILGLFPGHSDGSNNYPSFFKIAATSLLDHE
jgi:TadE-like protein